MQSLFDALAVAVLLSWTSSLVHAACNQGNCDGGWCTLGEGEEQRCMRVFDDERTLCSACTACANLGGQLLTITSAAEQDTVESAYGTTSFYIGLHRLGTAGGQWLWQGGSNSDYEVPDDGPPEDYDQCRAYHSYNGETIVWAYEACSREEYYACEVDVNPNLTWVPSECPEGCGGGDTEWGEEPSEPGCYQHLCTSDWNDCCAPHGEPQTCQFGYEPHPIAPCGDDPRGTYTCCSPGTEPEGGLVSEESYGYGDDCEAKCTSLYDDCCAPWGEEQSCDFGKKAKSIGDCMGDPNGLYVCCDDPGQIVVLVVVIAVILIAIAVAIVICVCCCCYCCKKSQTAAQVPPPQTTVVGQVVGKSDP
mmetsp:Transcript_13914/g.25650  ORF Transcript_13914/g.25650 Transcript_13914/m.25650 type:complete len:362 (+) Transcript_13914:125-1210(+)